MINIFSQNFDISTYFYPLDDSSLPNSLKFETDIQRSRTHNLSTSNHHLVNALKVLGNKNLNPIETEINHLDGRWECYGIERTEKFHVGLAASGGGVRAAAFTIGIMRYLTDNGFFIQIDYVSSVSGGGYATGSFITFLSSLEKEAIDEIINAETSENRRKELEIIKKLKGHICTGEIIDETNNPDTNKARRKEMGEILKHAMVITYDRMHENASYIIGQQRGFCTAFYCLARLFFVLCYILLSPIIKSMPFGFLLSIFVNFFIGDILRNSIDNKE